MEKNQTKGNVETSNPKGGCCGCGTRRTPEDESKPKAKEEEAGEQPSEAGEQSCCGG